MENYIIQIGKVIIYLKSPWIINWRKTDYQFVNKSLKNRRDFSIKIDIHLVEQLPALGDDLLYQTEAISVYRKVNQTEIRVYRAMFSSDSLEYVQSNCIQNHVDIFYDINSNFWNNGNMCIWNFMHLENFLLQTNALILHSCYTVYKDQAILFTAPSGTGKTTQANIWKRVYDIKIINGDKCLLQQETDTWYANGFPFHGNALECENKLYPIKAIVIVRQAKNNYIEKLTPIQKVALLFSECTVNSWNTEKIQIALSLLTDLVSRIPIIMLHCTMENNAAQVLHQYLYGEK